MADWTELPRSPFMIAALTPARAIEEGMPTRIRGNSVQFHAAVIVDKDDAGQSGTIAFADLALLADFVARQQPRHLCWIASATEEAQAVAKLRDALDQLVAQWRARPEVDPDQREVPLQ